MKGYYVMGCMKSRNRRTRHIDGVAFLFMDIGASTFHSYAVCRVHFLSVVVGHGRWDPCVHRNEHDGAQHDAHMSKI